ncbi:MAG: LCP family protein [Microbacteriaceae bacterium]|nr:LCP family protein [Microbacteriaceae bacterium]
MAKAAKTRGIKPVRHGKLRRSSSVANLLRAFLSMILIATFSVIAVTTWAVLDLGGRVKTIDLTPDEDRQKPEKQFASVGDLNILLVGSDTRQGQSYDDGIESELNDVTMLARISADKKRLTVISFSRDMLVPFYGCKDTTTGEKISSSVPQQLNETLHYGMRCVVGTLENLTGATIPYAAMITFDGVVNMSNAVGGVEVCLNKPIEDPNTDLSLPAGKVTLQGNNALQFLRTRYGVGDGGDVSRISNQQVFMSALMRSIQSRGTLGNPQKVYQLAKTSLDNMKMSSNMAKIDFMQNLANTVRNIKTEDINFVQYPAFTHPQNHNRLAPDERAGDLLMKKVLADEPIEVASAGAAAASARESAESSTTTPEPPTTEPNASSNITGILQPDGSMLYSDGTLINRAGTVVRRGSNPEAAQAAHAAAADGTGKKLPNNITGQNAANVLCSTGRVRY